MLKNSFLFILFLIPAFVIAQENKQVTEVRNALSSFEAAITNSQVEQIELYLKSNEKERKTAVAQLSIKQNQLIKLAIQGVEMYGKDEFSKCHKNAALYLGLLTYKPDYGAIASSADIQVRQDSAYIRYIDPMFNMPRDIILVKNGKGWAFDVDNESLTVTTLLKIDEGVDEYIHFMENLLSKDLPYQDFCSAMSPAIDEIYPKLKLY
jgi:hypothetical protein